MAEWKKNYTLSNDQMIKLGRVCLDTFFLSFFLCVIVVIVVCDRITCLRHKSNSQNYVWRTDNGGWENKWTAYMSWFATRNKNFHSIRPNTGMKNKTISLFKMAHIFEMGSPTMPAKTQSTNKHFFNKLFFSSFSASAFLSAYFLWSFN